MESPKRRIFEGVIMKTLISQAYSFAEKAHKGQEQSSGKPYFEHPKKVAQLLKKWKQNEEVICAGLLHDVVEDCDVSLATIKKTFGERVAFLVDGMSWEINKKTGIKDVESTYQKFANYSVKEPALILIKLADLTANIPNMKFNFKNQKEWFINKSYPRNMAFYIPFIRAGGYIKETDKIIKEFHKYVKIPINSIIFRYISKKQLNKIKNELR